MGVLKDGSRDVMTEEVKKEPIKFTEAEEKEINVDVLLTALEILQKKKQDAAAKDDFETASKNCTN